MSQPVQRILIALLAVALVIGLGGWSLYNLGGGRWTFADTMYMAAISAATVGFAELPGLADVTGARALTVLVILLGIAAFAFFQSSLTAFLVEGAIGEAFRRRRMERAIEDVKDHIIVAGCGSTGRHVVRELIATRTPFVVVDQGREGVLEVGRETGAHILFVEGDATHDSVLLSAGILRARGLVAALTHDQDNLYVTLSARTLNPKARIVTKVVAPEATAKMLRAGASSTVSPNTIGGLRMASELLRPNVVGFLDEMMRDRSLNVRIEEVAVPAGSRLLGRRLRESAIQEETNTLVVALRAPDGTLTCNPSRDLLLTPESVLIVMGAVDDIGRLRQFVLPERASVGT